MIDRDMNRMTHRIVGLGNDS